MKNLTFIVVINFIYEIIQINPLNYADFRYINKSFHKFIDSFDYGRRALELTKKSLTIANHLRFNVWFKSM